MLGASRGTWPTLFADNGFAQAWTCPRILDVYDEGSAAFPPYHPGMMVALLLYAYSQGDLLVAQDRRGGCEERLDFCGRVKTGMQRPDLPHDQRVPASGIWLLSPDCFRQVSCALVPRGGGS